MDCWGNKPFLCYSLSSLLYLALLAALENLYIGSAIVYFLPVDHVFFLIQNFVSFYTYLSEPNKDFLFIYK